MYFPFHEYTPTLRAFVVRPLNITLPNDISMREQSRRRCRYENLRRIVLRTSCLESSHTPGVLGFVPSRALATVTASSVHVKREPEPATTCKAHLRVLSDGWKRKHRLVLIDGDGSERVIASLGGHHHPFPGIFQPHISRRGRVRRVVATLASQRLRPTPCWRRGSPPSPRGEPTSARL